MSGNGMRKQYLSKKTLAKAEIKTHFFKIFGTMLTVLSIVGLILSVTGYNQDFKENMVIYILILAPSLLMLCSGIRTGKIKDLADCYNNIFECDEDGVVTIDELKRQTGKQEHEIVSEIDMLLKKNYLCCCTLERKGRVSVILSNGGDGADSGFVNAVCSVCGGTTRVRAGKGGVCQYCGRSLKG